MDPGAVISRMNAGRLYEIYFNATSRHVKAIIHKWLSHEYTHMPVSPHDAIPEGNMSIRPLNTYSDMVIDTAYNIVLELLKIINTEQYPGYLKHVNNRKVKEMILDNIIKEELYIYYRISSERKPYQIVRGLKLTPYWPITDKVSFRHDGKVMTSKKKIRIAPQYTILLAKTADNFLSCASAKTNHFGLPISAGNSQRNRLGWRNSPVRILSETEGRLYRAYANPVVMAELKDRATSLDTHTVMCKNILDLDKPTNVDVLIDRDKHPYGSDTVMSVIDGVFNAAGVKIDYVRDKHVLHPKLNH